ncbi:MAG: hypothetical protein Kow0062_25620 [Acidobacteriota bacterium]
MRRAFVTALVAALALTGCAGAGSPSLPDDDTARREILLRRAWGPEPPDVLERYLAVREQIAPRFRKYETGLTQMALREASSRAMFGKAVLGAALMRKDLDRALEQAGLTFADWERLTILVYGRWLRAVRGTDPPERRVARILQELEVAIARHLENAPPADPDERRALEDRLASVRHQLRFTAPFALLDPERTLAAIDPDTRRWLEEHRERIESLDFGVFDTMAPPRDRPRPAPPAGDAGA